MWNKVDKVIVDALERKFPKNLGEVKALDKEDGYLTFNAGEQNYLLVKINSSEGRVKFLVTDLEGDQSVKKDGLANLFLGKESLYFKNKNGFTTEQNVMYEDVKKILAYSESLA